MEAAIVSSLPQLGIAGAAIYVLYLMYKDSSARFAKKDEDSKEQRREHQATMAEHQAYLREVNQNTLTQLHNASRVIEENTKLYHQVLSKFNK